jgi:CubicO group peptidase (beta-lactamase class C family)
VPDFGKTITVRHLIHHTSGLREESSVQALMGRKFEDVMTRKDFLGWLKDQKDLNFAPGSEYVYCNTGYTLLGLIVERVSGKSVPAYAAEQIFRPLGMKNTVIRDHYGMVVKNSATSYGLRKEGGGFVHIPVPFEMPGATNVFTTVEDLALWDRNFYDGKVGGKAVLEQMHRKGRLNSGKEIAYAGGLALDAYRGLKTVSHTGSHGGYRSVLMRFPEQRFTVAVLSNLADVVPLVLARRVADVYLEGQFKSPEIPKDVKVDPKTYDAYAGDYKLVAGLILSVTREGDKLMAKTVGKKVRLEPLSETEFLHPESGLRCRFVKSASGKVEKVLAEVARQELEGSRIRKAELTAEQLAAYAGEFYSPELRVLYTVSVRDGKLRVRYPRGESPLRPWEGEEFSAAEGAPFNTLQFTRDAGKRVNGFLVSAGRLRNLRCTKVELKASP